MVDKLLNVESVERKKKLSFFYQLICYGDTLIKINA